MREKEYQEWIKDHYPDSQAAYGNCYEATKEMVAAFPELRRTNGFANVYMWNQERMHWWLVTQDGTIIDPTRAQFPGMIEYEEIDDSHPARNYRQERCMNCGGYYYVTPELDGIMHNEQCQREMSEYLNGPKCR